MKGTLKQRFATKVWINFETGCWEWTAYRDRTGYGRISIKNSPRLAHRVSYTLFFGSVPEGLTLDHLCRVRHCVNPEHLEPVTQRENLLRGDTIPAMWATRTHCAQGHLYDEDNTYTDKLGSRVCRKCNAARKWAKRHNLQGL